MRTYISHLRPFNSEKANLLYVMEVRKLEVQNYSITLPIWTVQ